MIKIIVTFNFSVTHIIYELLSDATAEAASDKFSEIEIDISPGSTLAYIFAPDEATSEDIVNHLCSPQYSKIIFNAKSLRAQERYNAKSFVDERRNDPDFCNGQNRKIAYPFAISLDIKKRLIARDGLNTEKDGCITKYQCPMCGDFFHINQLTVDHVPALVSRFNCREWRLSKENRKESFFDESQMRILCRSCNSQEKPNEQYDADKIIAVLKRKD